MADIAALRGALKGQLLTDGDSGYDEARHLWNGMFDKHPGAIARCADADDVIAAVNYGRESGMVVAVKSGGHSFPGHSSCDGGLVIDLSLMRGVTVDPQARTARAEGGALWGDLDEANQEHGLAVTGGQISHTGIAGLTLGGGIGWLMRKHGLTCDNLIGADVVTSDGRLVHASEQENADLFWGLRGGGGNFGIVTAFEYQLHPVGMVTAGLIGYPLPEGPAVLRAYREAVKDTPDELSTVAVVMTTPEGHQAVGIGVCYAGDPVQAEAAIAPFRQLGTAVMQQVGPMPYSVVQTMMNASAVPGRRYYMRSSFLDGVDDGFIDAVTGAYPSVPSPLTGILLVQMGGALARVAPDATAFAHRGVAFSTTIFSGWVAPEDDDANIAWTRELWSRLTPSLSRAVYVNELGDEGEDRVKAAYGASNYDRLAALKGKYDPSNLFRLNQNVKPAS